MVGDGPPQSEISMVGISRCVELSAPAESAVPAKSKEKER